MMLDQKCEKVLYIGKEAYREFIVAKRDTSFFFSTFKLDLYKADAKSAIQDDLRASPPIPQKNAWLMFLRKFIDQ